MGFDVKCGSVKGLAALQHSQRNSLVWYVVELARLQGKFCFQSVKMRFEVYY